MKGIYRMIVILIAGALILSACGTEDKKGGGVGMANPASVNCEQKGGTSVIQKRGDGGEYGVCVFEANRQCEEWAMYRGDCPEGGIDTTEYITAASLYCAISGGEYIATDKVGLEDEQGTCSLKSGKTCDAWELYNGTCDPNQ